MAISFCMIEKKSIIQKSSAIDAQLAEMKLAVYGTARALRFCKQYLFIRIFVRQQVTYCLSHLLFTHKAFI